MSDFKQAALYARKSVEIELKHGNHDLISSSLNTLAGIYMAGHQAKDAEKIILQAINHANQVDNPGRKAIILGMASEIYHTLCNDEEALSYAEQAIELEKSLNRPKKLVVRLSQKASALLGLHRYKEAEVICRQISPQLKENGDYHSYAITLNRLGMSLLCQERQQEAIPYYKEAAYLFSKMGDLYNEIHSQRGLYESYWTLNSDSAKQYLDTFELLKDSLYTRSTAEALSRYNAEFGNKQLQIENAKIRKTQHLIIVFAVVIILLFSIATWLIIQHSRKQMQDLVKKIERMKAISDASTREDSASQATTAEKEDSDEDMFLMHVIETVNTAMSNGNFGVEQIASELNISTQTFRRRLQNATGETPKAYIQAIQMERAITLLKQNQEFSISQIAQQCGFNDVSSFSHTFRRIYGCSPTRYREKQ
jgi:AraC-like DNA-binding protein